jgi:p-aminobenzoyl-glutamate transporter AbgT
MYRFFITGIVHGKVAKTIKNEKDVADITVQSMSANCTCLCTEVCKKGGETGRLYR